MKGLPAREWPGSFELESELSNGLSIAYLRAPACFVRQASGWLLPHSRELEVPLNGPHVLGAQTGQTSTTKPGSKAWFSTSPRRFTYPRGFESTRQLAIR